MSKVSLERSLSDVVGKKLMQSRFRARREQLETVQGLSPGSQDRILVLTVLYVPIPFARALLTETKVESGDVSKQKWNLC